jgi:PAS domain S-box-containing protein
VTAKDDEDKLLLSVAMQNANSVLIARRRAEQRSEAHLAEAQRLSQTGSFDWRVSTGDLLWSEETFRIFQYDRTTKPTMELVLQRVHEEDAALVRQTIESASQDGKNFEHECRLVMPDSSVKHVHVVAHVLGNERGSVEFVGAVMDVTAAKQAEERIRQNENELRIIIDAIPAMSWSALPDGSPDFFNQRWLAYTGLSLEEGRSCWMLAFHPEERPRIEEEWRATVATGAPFEKEARIRRADGEYRWFLIRAVPLRDELGRIVKWYGTITDIEDRKRAAMLLAGEKRLLEIIARGDSRALILDALCRLVEELASGSLSSILLLDAKTNRLRHGAAPSLPRSYTKAIDGLVIGPSAGSCGTAAYRAEPVIVSDIATDPLWVNYRDLALTHELRACWSRPILSSEGKVLGTFGTYYREPRSPTAEEHDVVEHITHLASIALEREQAEEVLRQAQADLAHVNRVTTMGELTASLAHEVNQPIAAVVTNAGACLQWLAGDTPNLEEARAAATRIVKGGTRAAEIISRIRLLFKKHTPQRESVDVNEVIREMIVLLRSEITRYSISVRTEQAADLPQVMSDRVQLQQIMMNLIINGIDAMKDVDGRRELAIKSQRGENKQIMVSVSDTGVGLPPHQADQIFNAFFTTKLHGTGMGLSISRSIIGAHGGRLWAADNSPRGASFHFTLPTKVEAHE